MQGIIGIGVLKQLDTDALNEIFDHLSDEYKAGKMSKNESQLLQEGFGDECMENTLRVWYLINIYCQVKELKEPVLKIILPFEQGLEMGKF